ncbi:hypothetical protein [Paraburkholderia sp. UCT70]|uniref:hypothetical protein n=1 Tax=Paraburkholderia sp. UCT70 TaxID=2991068 RepID=UPI003D1D70D4
MRGADTPIFTTCTAFAIPGATTNEAAATPIESTTKQAFIFNMANLLIALGKYSFEYTMEQNSPAGSFTRLPTEVATTSPLHADLKPDYLIMRKGLPPLTIFDFAPHVNDRQAPRR